MQVAAVGRGAITRICLWRGGRPRPSKVLGAAIISSLLLLAGSSSRTPLGIRSV